MTPALTPLDGVLVCDLSRLLPGPVCTSILRDLGARVVKVEEPGLGDYARWMPPDVDGHGHVFLTANRGKESITANLKTPGGVEVVRALARKADVFVETFRPGVADRLGVGYADIARENPGIVYLSLSGYGATGPMRDAPGHDLNYEALAGILHLQGRGADASPALSAVPVADYAGAHYGVIGVLAALLERAQTGRGRHLDVALADAARAVNAINVTRARVEPDMPRGGAEITGGLPSYDVYRTSDGRWLALGTLEDKFWVAFCRAVDRVDLEPHHLDREVREEVAGILNKRSMAEWIPILEAAGVPASPVLTPSEVPIHAQAMARPSTPLGEVPERPIPELGADTARILRELGHDDASIQKLRDAGAIG